MIPALLAIVVVAQMTIMPESAVAALIVKAVPLFAFAYFAVVWIGLWRAANRYRGEKIWSALVQAVVVLHVLFWLMAFITEFTDLF